jgi:hypothetical protein
MSTILLKTARQNLGAFVKLIATAVSTAAGLEADEQRGLRNLYAEIGRLGGPNTKGFYDILPGGKGDEVQVSTAMLDEAKDATLDLMIRLTEGLASKGEQRVTYSTGAKAAKGKPGEEGYVPAVKGHTVALDVDCSDFEVPDDETLDAIWANAQAGGSSAKADLSGLDL